MRTTLPARLSIVFMVATVSATLIAVDSNADQRQVATQATRQISVNESAQLYQVRHRGPEHEAQGRGSGTFPYPMTITFTVGFTQASVNFTIHAKGGNLYGQGNPSYRVEGSTAYISGSLSVTHGTGKYTHASGSGLALKGRLNRHNFALSIGVSGKMYM